MVCGLWWTSLATIWAMGRPPQSLHRCPDPSNYHDCNACPQYCNIDDFGDQNQVELCRLVGLPDLNQTNPYVSNNVLTTWIHDLVANYSFDGIRIDTVCEVNKEFWGNFKEASGVYSWRGEQRRRWLRL